MADSDYADTPEAIRATFKCSRVPRYQSNELGTSGMIVAIAHLARRHRFDTQESRRYPDRAVGQANPTILDEFGQQCTCVDYLKQNLRLGFDIEKDADRFVDLHHLPTDTRAQVGSPDRSSRR